MIDQLSRIVLPAQTKPKKWEPPQQWRCAFCFDTGAMLAEKIGANEGSYVFRCDCPMGSRDRRRFPFWSGTDKKIFQAIGNAVRAPIPIDHKRLAAGEKEEA